MYLKVSCTRIRVMVTVVEVKGKFGIAFGLEQDVFLSNPSNLNFFKNMCILFIGNRHFSMC